MTKLQEWNYESSEVATYLILLDRKQKYGEYAFNSCGIHVGSTLKASAYITYKVRLNTGTQKGLQVEKSRNSGISHSSPSITNRHRTSPKFRNAWKQNLATVTLT